MSWGQHHHFSYLVDIGYCNNDECFFCPFLKTEWIFDEQILQWQWMCTYFFHLLFWQVTKTIMDNQIIQNRKRPVWWPLHYRLICYVLVMWSFLFIGESRIDKRWKGQISNIIVHFTLLAKKVAIIRVSQLAYHHRQPKTAKQGSTELSSSSLGIGLWSSALSLSSGVQF